MDPDLQRAAQKVTREMQILTEMLGRGSMDDGHIELALAEAKRVRRDVTVLVRELARTRDQLQP